MKIGDKVMVEIYDQEDFGRGVGKINEKIIFVDQALPGEEVIAEITKINASFDEGKTIEIKKPSTDRVEYECPYYGECGGCQIGHQHYDSQLLFKEEKVTRGLGKFVDKDTINPILPSESRGYRNKGSFKIKNNKIGFYQAKSFKIVSIDQCLLMDTLINRTVQFIRNYLKDKTLHDNTIMIRSNGNMVSVKIEEELDEDFIEILKKESYIESIICKGEVKKGSPYLRMNTGGMTYEVSPESFFQVNSAITSKLYKHIEESVKLTKKETIVDLYCGVGTIGLSLAKKAKKIMGIEIEEKAIINAKNNALLNHIQHAQFNAGDVATLIQNINQEIDVLVVDPPRAGLDKKVVDKILALKPKTIIYVSCDLHTLKRDLIRLSVEYYVKEITPFDMFPNTYHVETCIKLMRSE